MWDRSPPTGDGPYIELMAGAYSDNRPDYSWVPTLRGAKVTKQYWYPIHAGRNQECSNLYAAVNLEVTLEGRGPRGAEHDIENRRARGAGWKPQASIRSWLRRPRSVRSSGRSSRPFRCLAG